MNIREAAGQLEQAIRAYGAKMPEGGWRIAPSAQRPVYLIGPPGVGKTAMVAQVAAKLGIGCVAYTMTHHTRQSALGLPLIVRRTLNGEERAVTEYTVSEIVAGVWEKVEAGAATGVLFLDEINCVSESLMPAVLQLLQYKTFGTHALPQGWTIVCAGNPPRYNRYAHTFDPVVMDRLRVIEVEPDLEAWQAYAAERGAHPVVRSYLRLRAGDFYVSDGDRIVTARSWTDLSDMMLAAEAMGDVPGEALFDQYLQVEEVAERFSLYHRLCASVGAWLDEAIAAGAGASLAGLPFDEAVFAALFAAGKLETQSDAAARRRREADGLANFVEGVARQSACSKDSIEALFRESLERLRRARAVKLRAGLLDEAGSLETANRLSVLEALAGELRGLPGDAAARAMRERCDEFEKAAREAESALERDFARCLDFAEAAFGDLNVLLIFLNELRGHEAAGRFAEKRLKARMDALWQRCDPEARAARLENRQD